MIVYRIQDKIGRGPWRPGFSRRWIEPRNDHLNLKPWYFDFELPKNINGHAGCGCRSILQLQRWISKKEYKKLRKYGFESVKIDADEIIYESDYQLIFTKSKPLYIDAKKFSLY